MKILKGRLWIVPVVLLSILFVAYAGGALQTQYTVHNTFESQIYVYSDNGELNNGLNKADEMIRIKVVVDDDTGINSVVASIYDDDGAFTGIQVGLMHTATNEYLSDWLQVSGLANGNYEVRYTITGTGEQADSTPCDLWIQHPDAPITHSIIVSSNGQEISSGGVVSESLNIKLEANAGEIGDGYIIIYQGTIGEYQQELLRLDNMDDILSGVDIDVSAWANDDYWFKLAVTGVPGFVGFEETFEFKVDNPVVSEGITSDIEVYILEDDGGRTHVNADGILHDVIVVTATPLSGSPDGYVMTISDTDGNVLYTLDFVEDDGVWECQFNTRVLINGNYVFNIAAVKGSDLVPQSSFSVGLFTPGNEGMSETTWFLWVIILVGAGVVLFLYSRHRSGGTWIGAY